MITLLIIGKAEDKKSEIIVLDPFMGCGTTLLTCNLLGIESYGLDVSYLSYIVTKVKTETYEENDIKEFEKFVSNISLCEKEKGMEFSSEFFDFQQIMPKRNLSKFRNSWSFSKICP